MSKEIETFVIDELRRENPWMKIQAVREAARAVVELVQGRVDEQQDAIRDAKERCSFLSLSPELRNRIYELALRLDEEGEGGVQYSTFIRIEGPRTYKYYRTSAWLEQPALTRISRQIRKETLPIYYGMNFFAIYAKLTADQDPSGSEHYQFDFKGAEKWLERIGPENAALIKKLDLSYPWNAYSGDIKDYKAYHRDLAERLESYGVIQPGTTIYMNYAADTEDENGRGMDPF